MMSFSFRRCLSFFTPPHYRITKESIKEMDLNELKEFPLVRTIKITRKVSLYQLGLTFAIVAPKKNLSWIQVYNTVLKGANFRLTLTVFFLFLKGGVFR